MSNDLPYPVLMYLRDVAEGKVLPEMLTRFAGTSFMAEAAQLPLADQRKLADPNYEAVLRREGVKFGTKKPVLRLTPAERRQWIVDHKIVPVDKQVLPAKTERGSNPRPTPKPANETEGLVIVLKNLQPYEEAAVLSAAAKEGMGLGDFVKDLLIRLRVIPAAA